MIELNKHTIYCLDSAFEDESFLKSLIMELFRISEEASKEKRDKFGIIFLNIGKRGEKYLNIDYKLLIISLLNILHNNIPADDYIIIKKMFSFDDYTELNNTMRKLLFMLKKSDLVYTSNSKKYFIQCKYAKKSEDLYFTSKFDSISFKYHTILKLFDEKTIESFDKIITKDYLDAKDKDNKRLIYVASGSYSDSNYVVEEYSRYRELFFDEKF